MSDLHFNYIDWNCHLLTGLHETMTDPTEAVKALSFMQSKFGFHTFCMMPYFYPDVDSVSFFLMRRRKALSAVADGLSDAYSRYADQPSSHFHFQMPVKLLVGATVCMEPKIHQIFDLGKLQIRFGNDLYLPIRLPLGDYADWIDLELNRLLYQSKFRLLFSSFELPCILYTDEILTKLTRISNAIYQFNYRALENPRILRWILHLLHQNAKVIFGTSLDCLDKAYFYDFDYYLRSAKANCSSADYAMLLKYALKLPLKHPSVFRH